MISIRQIGNASCQYLFNLSSLKLLLSPAYDKKKAIASKSICFSIGIVVDFIEDYRADDDVNERLSTGIHLCIVV